MTTQPQDLTNPSTEKFEPTEAERHELQQATSYMINHRVPALLGFARFDQVHRAEVHPGDLIGSPALPPGRGFYAVIAKEFGTAKCQRVDVDDVDAGAPISVAYKDIDWLVPAQEVLPLVQERVNDLKLQRHAVRDELGFANAKYRGSEMIRPRGIDEPFHVWTLDGQTLAVFNNHHAGFTGPARVQELQAGLSFLGVPTECLTFAAPFIGDTFANAAVRTWPDVDFWAIEDQALGSVLDYQLVEHHVGAHVATELTPSEVFRAALLAADTPAIARTAKVISDKEKIAWLAADVIAETLYDNVATEWNVFPGAHLEPGEERSGPAALQSVLEEIRSARPPAKAIPNATPTEIASMTAAAALATIRQAWIRWELAETSTPTAAELGQTIEPAITPATSVEL